MIVKRMDNVLRENGEPPKQGDLLQKTVMLLKSAGHSIKEGRADRTGKTYTMIMQTQQNFPYALVCKGSEIMRDIVSFQEELLEEWKGPIILAWSLDETSPDWFLFDPFEIWANKLFLNERFGVKMVNFRIGLGIGLQFPTDEEIMSAWGKLKKKRSMTLTAYQ